MKAQIKETNPESYHLIYMELFSKFEAKRNELENVVSAENSIGSSWRKGNFVGELPSNHNSGLVYYPPKHTKRVGLERDIAANDSGVKKPNDPGMQALEGVAEDNDPELAFSFFNTLEVPHLRASRTHPTIDRS